METSGGSSLGMVTTVRAHQKVGQSWGPTWGPLFAKSCLIGKKVPKRTPRKIIKLSKGAPTGVLRSIRKRVSVFSHDGDSLFQEREGWSGSRTSPQPQLLSLLFGNETTRPDTK